MTIIQHRLMSAKRLVKIINVSLDHVKYIKIGCTIVH